MREVESPPEQEPNAPEFGLTVTDNTSGAAFSASCTPAVDEPLAAAAWLTTSAGPATVSANTAQVVLTAEAHDASLVVVAPVI